MTLNLLIGADAELLLRDSVFQHQWNSLYAECPWATPCQSYGFVTTWYQVYREPFKPVILSEVMPDGSLGGLLTLALTEDSNQLVFAGAEQSEYNTWLARADNGDIFIEAAMNVLSASFPKLTLIFEYLPPLAPRQWLAAGRPWGRSSMLASRSRPLLKLGDGENLRKSWKKSSNKSRFNRLKRLGDVKFEQLHTEAELAPVFDEIISFYDFRQGAVNDSVPFQKDPLKKQFRLALMRVKDLQNVTVLKVGERVVAAHLGLSDRQQCIVGIPAHSPFHAIHSPGKLNLLMLGMELANQGFETIDLTAGGDAYKERFATDRDQVYVLTIFLGRQAWQKQKAELKLRLKSILKGLILASGIELKNVLEFVGKVRRLRLSTIADWYHSLGRKIGENTKYCVYCYKASEVMIDDRVCSMKTDCLNDLLAFQPGKTQQTRQDFLSLCLKRLEAGEHVYTWVENDCLRYHCWLIERQEKFFCADLAQEYIFEPESAFIYDYHLHPITHQSGENPLEISHKLGALLEQMVNDAVYRYGAKQVYITVRADDSFRDLIEKAGFALVST